jgi:hypothetical protein
VSVCTPQDGPIEIGVCGKRFHLARHEMGWSWTHLSDSEIGIVAESQVIFPEAGEALVDLMEYAGEVESA